MSILDIQSHPLDTAAEEEQEGCALGGRTPGDAVVFHNRARIHEIPGQCFESRTMTVTLTPVMFFLIIQI